MHSSNTYKPGGFLKRTDPLHPFLPSEPIALNQSESFEFFFKTDHVMVHMCTIILPEDRRQLLVKNGFSSEAGPLDEGRID